MTELVAPYEEVWVLQRSVWHLGSVHVLEHGRVFCIRVSLPMALVHGLCVQSFVNMGCVGGWPANQNFCKIYCNVVKFTPGNWMYTRNSEVDMLRAIDIFALLFDCTALLANHSSAQLSRSVDGGANRFVLVTDHVALLIGNNCTDLHNSVCSTAWQQCWIKCK